MVTLDNALLTNRCCVVSFSEIAHHSISKYKVNDPIHIQCIAATITWFNVYYVERHV